MQLQTFNKIIFSVIATTY